MHLEISAATDFVRTLLSKKLQGHTSIAMVTQFCNRLEDELHHRFTNHWLPSSPKQGSAYRCIHTTTNKMDPAIRNACLASGTTLAFITAALPPSLTLWIDPGEFSYRLGQNSYVCHAQVGMVVKSASSPLSYPPGLEPASPGSRNTLNVAFQSPYHYCRETIDDSVGLPLSGFSPVFLNRQ